MKNTHKGVLLLVKLFIDDYVEYSKYIKAFDEKRITNGAYIAYD